MSIEYFILHFVVKKKLYLSRFMNVQGRDMVFLFDGDTLEPLSTERKDIFDIFIKKFMTDGVAKAQRQGQ